MKYYRYQIISDGSAMIIAAILMASGKVGYGQFVLLLMIAANVSIITLRGYKK